MKKFKKVVNDLDVPEQYIALSVNSTNRLGTALPFTLSIFAVAAFAAVVVFIIYSAMTVDNMTGIRNYIDSDPSGDINELFTLTRLNADMNLDKQKSQLAYQGGVLGFLVIISYCCVYSAMHLHNFK